MRFIGAIFVLLGLGALALDFMDSRVSGAFELRSLDEQLSLDLGIDLFDLYQYDIAASVLELPGAIVLGGFGLALILVSAVLFGARR